ncbi:hypothetical protein FRB94_006163 [Tulasnella sp. JGI-2019a]|nr:hypothetical protein FRB94_006163 [Tulasnella sp. JGI-2019a]
MTDELREKAGHILQNDHKIPISTAMEIEVPSSTVRKRALTQPSDFNDEMARRSAWSSDRPRPEALELLAHFAKVADQRVILPRADAMPSLNQALDEAWRTGNFYDVAQRCEFDTHVVRTNNER